MELTPQKDAPPGFPFSEKKLRAQIGLPKDDLRALRNLRLIEATHYTRGKQQSVWLNQAGVDTLLAALPGPVEASAAKRAGSGSPHVLAPLKSALLNLLRARVGQLGKTPPPVELRVVNCTLPHKHMLLACALDEDHFRPKRTVRVRVNLTANFVRGMVIPVRLVAGYTDLYDLTRRCPRQKGKW